MLVGARLSDVNNAIEPSTRAAADLQLAELHCAWTDDRTGTPRVYYRRPAARVIYTH